MTSKKITTWIIINLIAGITVGFALNYLNNTAIINSYANNVSIISEIFLRLIKMVIAPLIISTLVVGITKMGDTKTLGRIFLKTLTLFFIASLISITIGLIIVNIFKPGIGINFIPNKNLEIQNIKSTIFSFHNFIINSIPISIVEAMSKNEILQIVIFSLFMGCSLFAIGPKSKPIIEFLNSLIDVMLKITSYIMLLAPITVFAAISTLISQHGLNILISTSIFMTEFYFTLILLWIILIGISTIIIGPRIINLINNIKEPALIAFTTSSSEAAFPSTLRTLEKFGISNKIASFVLPIGYSFNLVGSMAYCSFAIIFISQACNIHLNFNQQITMLLILMLTSKGMAGVPRASLVIIAATLTQFNIPESGLILLMGVDPFLDMGRSATNVMSNSIGTLIIAHWEGENYNKENINI